MRLYEISGEKTAGMTTRQYVGSQADAGKARKEMKAAGVTMIETAEIDVPTDKAGLLAFLNKQAGAVTES